MNYDLKNNLNRKGVGVPMKITAVIAGLLICIYFFAPHFFPSLFSFLVHPLWTNTNSARDASLVSTETDNAFVRQLQKENADLKEILGRSDAQARTKHLILAQILKKPPYSAYDTFILDIGSDRGIVVGDKVYALGNILIGEISEVTTGLSKAKLYSSYGEKYEVFIGKNSLEATSTGRGGGAFEASFPRDSKVSEGDTVTIPSISQSVFGTVQKILTDPAQPFSTILFSQPINMYEQTWVEIEQGSDKVEVPKKVK